MTAIQRKPVTIQANVAVDTVLADSTPVTNEAAASLMVRRTSGTTATINIFGAATVGGTYLQMTFEGADLTATVTATDWEVLPAAVYAAPWLKFVGDADGVVEVAGKG
jgi:hypothetical protein